MLKLDKETGDLSAIARAAAELYTEVAEAKSVTLQLTLAEHLPVQADAIRLRQAVANLVDNAVKYTPEGGTVFVATLLVGGEAIVRVSDTGSGVPVVDQARMWDRLYRGDASRSQRGLGLGLSMVRAIVEAHGGQVAYRNRAGGGAEFEVRLPAVTAEPSPAS
jgi:signal transduction histidine kinase